ncbi:13856_t:CDS:2 [Funneliformis geosporum]|nr:13856_t:CDS:2 [Funneliformis geosporum]
MNKDIITQVLQEILQADPNYFLPKQLHVLSKDSQGQDYWRYKLLPNSEHSGEVKSSTSLDSVVKFQARQAKSQELNHDQANNSTEHTIQNLSTSLQAIQPADNQNIKLITYLLLGTALTDYLPDFKGTLQGFYEENIQPTLETKTAYYENLLQENIAFGQRTQKIAIALGIGIFLLLAIAYF